MITASGDRGAAHWRIERRRATTSWPSRFDQAELLAAVRSLLRIKRYHDTIEGQAAELAEWNRDARAAGQRPGRASSSAWAGCGGSSSPQLADLVVSSGDESFLESHRREITVVFCDLRGFTAVRRDRSSRRR